MNLRVGLAVLISPFISAYSLPAAFAYGGFDIGSLSSLMSDPDAIIRKIPNMRSPGIGNITSIKSLTDIKLTGTSRYGISNGKFQEFVGVATKGGGDGYIPVAGLQKIMKQFGGAGSRNQVISMLKGASGGRMPALSGASPSQLMSLLPKDMMPQMMKFAEKNPALVRQLTSNPQIAGLMSNKDVMKMIGGIGGLGGFSTAASASSSVGDMSPRSSSVRSSTPRAASRPSGGSRNVASASPSSSTVASIPSGGGDGGSPVSGGGEMPGGTTEPIPEAMPGGAAAPEGTQPGAGGGGKVGQKQECAKTSDEFDKSENLKKVFTAIGSPFRNWNGATPLPGLTAVLSPRGSGQWNVTAGSFHNQDFVLSVCGDESGKPYFDVAGKKVAINVKDGTASAYISQGSQGTTFKLKAAR